MGSRLVVIGAGGFGRETVDVIEALNAERADVGEDAAWDLLGVVDDSPSETNLARLADRGIAHLGSLDEVLDAAPTGLAYAVGIGSPAVRRRIAERCDDAGLAAATLVHPSATIGSRVSLGPGTVVCAGARVTTNIEIGRHVHINPNVTIGHDTVVEDYVSLNPQAAISGDCVLETGVLVGVAGVVLNGLRVGAGAIVGGAACAVGDVEPGIVVVGVPARPLVKRGA